MLEAQSFATGGWGPEELLRKPGTDELAKSLTASHNSFETPCGGYAHMKLTRSLLRATRDGRYGDSMERVFYNTVLGALPLQPDGRSFYNSDYSVLAKRVYSVHGWPCCSGTLPQVVADYGINTYLHTPGELWVNLYQPSEVRFQIHGKSFSLTQTTTYPEDPEIHLRLAGFRPASFTLRLRIPAWTGGAATLQVNRHAVALAVESGFASVTRLWRPGDEVTLTLPLSLRLEPLPANGGPAHPASVALLRGPLVLFALRDPAEAGPVPAPLSIPRDTLLNAQRSGPREWTVATSAGPRRFVAFTDIGDRTYSTYLIATG
jgi:DUF1680 family protein